MMLEKIHLWICRKELEKLDEIWNERRIHYETKLNELQAKVEHSTKQQKQHILLENIFQKWPDAVVLGLFKNKIDQEFIALVKDDPPDKGIFLVEEGSSLKIEQPVIAFKVVDKYPKKYIYIIDVTPRVINVGNGSIAMYALIKYAKEIEATYITGKFSSVDNDHADRRNHFYEKFGFMINSNGTIRLDL